MLPWITNRLPTEKDADVDGDIVCVCDFGGGWQIRPAKDLRPGTPWLPYNPPGQPWQHSQTVPRKIVQLIDSSDLSGCLALADDGTLWQWRPNSTSWAQIKPLPDREEP